MSSSHAIKVSVNDCFPSRSFHQEGVNTIWNIDPCSSFSLGLNSKYNLRKASKPLPRSVSLTIESAVPFLVWPMLVLIHIGLVLELCDLHGGLRYLTSKAAELNLW